LFCYCLFSCSLLCCCALICYLALLFSLPYFICSCLVFVRRFVRTALLFVVYVQFISACVCRWCCYICIILFDLLRCSSVCVYLWCDWLILRYGDFHRVFTVHCVILRLLDVHCIVVTLLRFLNFDFVLLVRFVVWW
jgi:hypothetical protein